MKYAFVTLSILTIWIALILIVISLHYEGIVIPLVALGMTLTLYIIGFGRKK